MNRKIISIIAIVIVIIIALFAMKSPARRAQLANQPTPAVEPTQAVPTAQPLTGPTESQPTTKPTKKPMDSKVTTTASGLQYEVLTKGTGTTHPSLTSVVKVHYHGTLLDGTVFDSSVDRGEPAEFPLNRVITGWQEGLQLMKVGDKFKFTIPANLAYGDMSPSPKIPAGSTLVFTVELLGIK